MYDIYTNFYNKYKDLYGSKVAVFLMVGSFYELYDIQDTITGATDCNVKDIIDVLGIQLSIKKDVPASIKDADKKIGLFAGVPDYTIHKWAAKLTGAGWSVVIVDQVKDSKGSVSRREVSRVLSPSTHIEALGNSETAYILGLIFEEDPLNIKAPSFTAAAFDLSTGRTFTFNGGLSGRGDIWYSDELTHFLQVFAPREIVIWWNGADINKPQSQQISKTFGLSASTAVYIRNYSLGMLESPLIQEEYLRKLYNIRSMLPVCEWLYITPKEQPGLILLLKFIEEHLPSSFQLLERNQRWIPKSAVRLGNAALTQLQLIAPNIRESVLGLYDKCITSIGKRGLRNRLLNPIWDASILNQRLQRIENLQAISKSDSDALITSLRSVYDIPRIHRRLLCGTISAEDIISLHTSYLAAKSLLTMNCVLANYSSLCNLGDIHLLISSLEAEFDIKKAEQGSSDNISFLPSHKYLEIKKAEEDIETIIKEIEGFKAKVCTAINMGPDVLQIENKNNIIVMKGSVRIMKALQAVGEHKQYIHLLKSGGTYEHPSLTLLGYKLMDKQAQLKKATDINIPVACDKFSVLTKNIWYSLEEFIETLDIDRCIAVVSIDRGFNKPIIVDGAGAADFKFENLRHPLIESTLTRTEYVKHNITMDDSSRGWLVYGMNASGKSSLMKSVGIAVLLAQVGAFVPASYAKITPFKSLFTRILNQDNLWAGLSSFAVEMSELREIFTYADENTLILGDELCSGTESASAHALVAAGIDWLSNKHAKYIFATHLHGLLDILPSPETLSLSVFHLRVVYDAVHDRLIYERTLTPGSGSSLYGLEVARAMHVPVEYYERALNYRKKFLGDKQDQEIGISAWNPHILRKSCEICGAKDLLEVHHIRQRKDANPETRRFEDGDARDNARNLVVVCAACHDKHHAGAINIKPIQATSDGPVRIMEPVAASALPEPAKPEQETLKCRGRSEEEMKIIDAMIRENKSSPLKRITLLLKEEGITISEASLRAIRNKLNQ